MVDARTKRLLLALMAKNDYWEEEEAGEKGISASLFIIIYGPFTQNVNIDIAFWVNILAKSNVNCLDVITCK